MPRPLLTKDRVVQASVVLVREVGLEAVADQRIVARRVHATMTGVGRVVSPIELMAAVVEEIVAEMPAVPQRGHWTTRLRRWAAETREWGLDHPGIANHLLAHPLVDDVSLDRLERLGSVVAATGVGLGLAIESARWLMTFVLVRVVLEERPGVLGTVGAEPVADRVVSESGRWPLLQKFALDRQGQLDGSFTFGVELVIDCVEQRIPGAPPQ